VVDYPRGHPAGVFLTSIEHHVAPPGSGQIGPLQAGYMRQLPGGDSMGAMTAVFVYEVPETPAVWHGLLAALDRSDTVALSLPGFDSARSAGFGATMEEYAGWLAAELECLGDPPDLVGHDGGGVLAAARTGPQQPAQWVTERN
jgi:pimeloyl-ACP methyl ester carboxylesterase